MAIRVSSIITKREYLNRSFMTKEIYFIWYWIESIKLFILCFNSIFIQIATINLLWALILFHYGIILYSCENLCVILKLFTTYIYKPYWTPIKPLLLNQTLWPHTNRVNRIKYPQSFFYSLLPKVGTSLLGQFWSSNVFCFLLEFLGCRLRVVKQNSSTRKSQLCRFALKTDFSTLKYEMFSSFYVVAIKVSVEKGISKIGVLRRVVFLLTKISWWYIQMIFTDISLVKHVWRLYQIF